MAEVLSPGAKKFQDALTALGAKGEVVELPASTRTSAEAASAIGCSIGQIAKSIIFRAVSTGRPVMVIASGINRIHEEKIQTLIGEAVKKADPDFVRQATGFAIGGVPPIGHAEPILTIIDEDLTKLDEIWAAAGSPHAVFKLSPASLIKMTGGSVKPIK
ncbi:MAG: prolyl-tRNA editing protein [Chloroflexi bacterium RBG_13_60_9]|nr:MAG: prolyl-tRNA editing protein [Chloroflexi bacterium RBG_13_60_9]